MADTPLQIRGPLRYQVETSTPQIEAGKEFSVFIRITNSYDVEAKLKGVTTKLPAKFQDIEALNRDRKKEQYHVNGGVMGNGSLVGLLFGKPIDTQSDKRASGVQDTTDHEQQIGGMVPQGKGRATPLPDFFQIKIHVVRYFAYVSKSWLS